MSSTELSGKEVLEDIIQSCLSWLPEWVTECLNDDVKKMWEYEKADDFVLGLTTGMIYAHFKDWFVTINRRELAPLEREEVMTKILMRTSQIKKAFFGTETGTESGTGI